VSEFKGTPGPWRHYPDDNIIVSADGRLLDWVARSLHVTREQRDANARLVSAAPDLLGALIAITDQLERVGDTRPHKDGEFIEQARAAIAKALGEQP